MNSKHLDAEALDKENLELHRKLAAAELDARTAWARYEGANNSRKATDAQLQACTAEKDQLAKKLAKGIGALKEIDHVMKTLYGGGFHQKVLSQKLANRTEFAKIIGLARTWVSLIVVPGT
jgi:hypothetical protein